MLRSLAILFVKQALL